jgi:mannose-6-phosphate isomerase-like protein (cupin superfamily)
VKKFKNHTMKNLILKNVATVQGQKINRDGNKFTVKNIISDVETSKCRASFVEVEAGNYAYGYHYHEANEEVFYIISGTGVVRTQDGEISVKAGDAIGFPTGKNGSRVMQNKSATNKWTNLDSDSKIVQIFISPEGHLTGEALAFVFQNNATG